MDKLSFRAHQVLDQVLLGLKESAVILIKAEFGENEEGRQIVVFFFLSFSFEIVVYCTMGDDIKVPDGKIKFILIIYKEKDGEEMIGVQTFMAYY